MLSNLVNPPASQMLLMVVISNFNAPSVCYVLSVVSVITITIFSIYRLSCSNHVQTYLPISKINHISRRVKCEIIAWIWCNFACKTNAFSQLLTENDTFQHDVVTRNSNGIAPCYYCLLVLFLNSEGARFE